MFCGGLLASDQRWIRAKAFVCNQASTGAGGYDASDSGGQEVRRGCKRDGVHCAPRFPIMRVITNTVILQRCLVYVV